MKYFRKEYFANIYDFQTFLIFTPKKKSKLQITRIYIHIGTRDDGKISVSCTVEKIRHK